MANSSNNILNKLLLMRIFFLIVFCNILVYSYSCAFSEKNLLLVIASGVLKTFSSISDRGFSHSQKRLIIDVWQSSKYATDSFTYLAFPYIFQNRVSESTASVFLFTPSLTNETCNRSVWYHLLEVNECKSCDTNAGSKVTWYKNYSKLFREHFLMSYAIFLWRLMPFNNFFQFE